MRPYPQRTRLLRGVRDGRPPAGLPTIVAASIAAGLLLAWAEVSLADFVSHPWWSLRRIVTGVIDALVRIGWGTLQAMVVIVPVWLLAGAARARRRSA